jgi:hypothetical protein
MRRTQWLAGAHPVAPPNPFRVTTMKRPIVRFPVICPRCGEESLTEVSIALAAEALMRNEGAQLKAACHNLYWTASPAEMQQLRKYMGAVI